MPIREISFNRYAVKDYRDARDWYAKRSEQAAGRFVDGVDVAVQRIIEMPDSFPAISPKYRRVRVEKFPHVLVYYMPADQVIRIVTVAHTSRRPGYWRRRT
jgi:plasmid stabilization system protein ParE